MSDRIRPRRSAIPWNRVGLFLGGWTWPLFTGMWLLNRNQWLAGGVLLGLLGLAVVGMVRRWRSLAPSLVVTRPSETLGTINILTAFLPAWVMMPLMRYATDTEVANDFFEVVPWWQLWLAVTAACGFCLAIDFLHQRQLSQEDQNNDERSTP